jgi:mevalonate kinase
MKGKQTLARENNFHGRGKILLSGEYFVMEGALSLSLPTTVGQKLKVKTKKSFDPILNWKSFDAGGELWLEAQFEFWHFNSTNNQEIESKEVLLLQKILRQIRLQNPHFLRDDEDVYVETYLEFPLKWGLGSSSTLIHNLSKWAKVAPFELLFKTLGGSGYDVACAESNGPILYKRGKSGPKWTHVDFNPSFKEHLFFIYLGEKTSTQTQIQIYKDYRNNKDKLELSEIVSMMTKLTKRLVMAKTLMEFENIIELHENIIADQLKLDPIKKSRFPDYDQGSLKSLGGWGGDFALVTLRDLSRENFEEMRNYFLSKGVDTIIPYSELVFDPIEEKNPIPPYVLNNMDDPIFPE